MSIATIPVPPIHSTFGDDSPRARRSDPETSHFAADLANLSKPRNWVLDAIAREASADHELLELALNLGLHFTGSRIRTARAELTRLGLVEESGIYRMTENNRRAIVWQFAEESTKS